MLLKPGDARQLSVIPSLSAGNRLGIGPDAETCVCQTFPGEQRAGVELARRRNIAVTDDVLRVDFVARGNVLEQGDQGLDLTFGIRVPDPTLRRVAKALVDDFDTDGAGIQPGAAFPLAFAGVPGALVFIHQFVEGRRGIANQVVAAHRTVGEQLKRALQRGRCVMQHDELHTAVVIDRRMAGVHARPAGTTGQQQGRQNQGVYFHGLSFSVGADRQQHNVRQAFNPAQWCCGLPLWRDTALDPRV